MAPLEMNGPYKLDKDTVNKIVTKVSAGNYALGKKTAKERSLFIMLGDQILR